MCRLAEDSEWTSEFASRGVMTSLMAEPRSFPAIDPFVPLHCGNAELQAFLDFYHCCLAGRFIARDAVRMGCAR